MRGLQQGYDPDNDPILGTRVVLALLVAVMLALPARAGIEDGPEPVGIKADRISLPAQLHGGVIRTVGLRVYTACPANGGEEFRCQSACDNAASAWGRVSLAASCSISWFVYPVIQGSVECTCHSYEPVMSPNPGTHPCDMCGGALGQ